MRLLHLASLPFALALVACGPSSTSSTSSSSPGESSGETSGSTGGTSSSGSATDADPPTTTRPDAELTATTTTGEELSTSVGSAESATFIISPDGGVCQGASAPDGEFRCSQCDPFVQDCPDDSKCSPYANDGSDTWNSIKCVPITGDGLAGDPCTVVGGPGSGKDDCALGHVCWKVDDQLHGECVALCTGNPVEPQCGAGTVCVVSAESPAALCIPTCDPLLQDCDASEVCIFSNFGFVCAPGLGDEAVGVNEPCQFPNQCDPGLACLDANITSSECMPDSSCCTPMCSFPGGACPNADQACISWWDPGKAPPGEEDIGVCAIP